MLFLLVSTSNPGAERIPWTNSKVKGSPEPPPPYLTARAFTRLKFSEPLELTAMPGSDRLVLVEQRGKIYSFPANNQTERADLFADIKKLHPDTTEVYSLAFHPQFEKNRFVYIWYMLQHEKPEGTKIARFKVKETHPPEIDPETEKVVFTWKSGGHNGGAIRFGKDGYMYLGTGDGVGPTPPDGMNTGQDISDLLSSILRIDVDAEEQGRTYRIPPDNPFVSTPGARGEIWAYGFRNPWRMSFDRETGDLWVGDVGWELWEMIYRVEKGGNYGWSVMEGSSQVVRRDLKPGPTPILPPTVEHPHSEAASITGGVVYYGSQHPELRGSYIYGDYETGKIWELRLENNRVVKHREIASTRHKISSFGEIPNGELYIVDHLGTLHRLVKNSAADIPHEFPKKLSDTGLFSNVARHELASGVVDYSIKTSMWKDYATGTRFAAWPGKSTAKLDGTRLEAPNDAVLAKTYSLEMESGNSSSRRHIETQVLHFSEGKWNPYTYAWNEEQTDAFLVESKGAVRELVVKDASAPGGKRVQNWRLHSRAECLRCHNSWCGTVLGFNDEQVNRESWAMLVSRELSQEKDQKLVNPHDAQASLDSRARSYLHINCSHCHRENAGGSVLSFMNIEMPLPRAGLLGTKPAQGSFGIPEPAVVAPGDPLRSVLYFRMSKMGSGHMPYLGSSLVDPAGIELIREWIAALKPGQEPTLTSEMEEKFQQFNRNPDARKVTALLQNPAGGLRLMQALDAGEFNPAVRELVIREVAGADNFLVRDLFDRFLPAEQRVQTLGLNVDPAFILPLQGDQGRGRSLFFEERGQCSSCHRIDGAGKDFGPDLSQIGQKYSKRDLLEHILEPSKVLAPEYIGYSVELADDSVHTGFVLSRSEREILLKEQNGQLRVPLNGSEKVQSLKLSLMPEGLLQSWTAQQAADLLEFLSRQRN